MTHSGQPCEPWFTETHQDQYGISLRIRETLFRKQSAHQLVEVLDTEGFGRLLVLDGTIMCTERDEFVYHEMLAHVPLCAHADPREVLIIGGGDGGTLRETLKHPSVRRVDRYWLRPGFPIWLCIQLPNPSLTADDPDSHKNPRRHWAKLV